MQRPHKMTWRHAARTRRRRIAIHAVAAQGRRERRRDLQLRQAELFQLRARGGRAPGRDHGDDDERRGGRDLDGPSDAPLRRGQAVGLLVRHEMKSPGEWDPVARGGWSARRRTGGSSLRPSARACSRRGPPWPKIKQGTQMTKTWTWRWASARRRRPLSARAVGAATMPAAPWSQPSLGASTLSADRMSGRRQGLHLGNRTARRARGPRPTPSRRRQHLINFRPPPPTAKPAAPPRLVTHPSPGRRISHGSSKAGPAGAVAARGQRARNVSASSPLWRASRRQATWRLPSVGEGTGRPAYPPGSIPPRGLVGLPWAPLGRPRVVGGGSMATLIGLTGIFGVAGEEGMPT